MHSVAGLLWPHHLSDDAPLLGAAHPSSDVGLIGGGPVPMPGEVVLAHHSMRFEDTVDALPEFRRNVLEVLRPPREMSLMVIVCAGLVMSTARHSAMAYCLATDLSSQGQAEIREDLRRMSIWKVGGRTALAARMDAATDVDGMGCAAPRPPDPMASSPMVAVGAVSDQRARLWLRTDVLGPFTVEVWTPGSEVRAAMVADRRTSAQDGTMAFTLPDDAPALGLLAPATAYGFRITVARTGAMVGEGQFETAPVEGARGDFKFAFMSCHQPFRPDGSVHPASARMMAALEPALEARGLKYTLLIGDQIYADAPVPHQPWRADRLRPLREASMAEIRARYQARYRQFWGFPEMRRLQARRPTWCIWDDHEIVNDWGARRVHQQPAWRRLFEGARLAFIDYQACRTVHPDASWPSTFQQTFVWGSAATFIMDLSSQRTIDGRAAQVYGADQLAALTTFLREHRARPVVFVVLSVPPVYLPDWVVAWGERMPGQGALFATRWNAAQNQRARDQLLDVLWAHQRATPGQKLVLLSGDVHQGAAVALRWPDGAQVYQFVSSPITNALRPWKERIARRLSFSMGHVRHGTERVAVTRLGSACPGQQNPFNGLNVGVVHVEDMGDGAAIRFELLTYDEGTPGGARVVYKSGWLWHRLPRMRPLRVTAAPAGGPPPIPDARGRWILSASR